MQVTKEFNFDAAHFVPDYYGKCERMHGHTYKLQVTVEGDVGQKGMTFDFVLLKRMVQQKVLDKLDHQVINDVIKVATAENVAIWIWDQLVDLKANLQEQFDDPDMPASIIQYYQDQTETKLGSGGFSDKIRLFEVKLWETPTSWVTYRG